MAELFALPQSQVYLECSHGTLMIKTPDMIESEVNDFVGFMWQSIEPLARKDNDYDNAQHQLCHVTAMIYDSFHAAALDTYAETGSQSLWEIVETLTDKVIACNTHVKELSL